MSRRFLPYVSSLVAVSCTTIIVQLFKVNLLPRLQKTLKDQVRNDHFGSNAMTTRMLSMQGVRDLDVEAFRLYLVFLRFWYKTVPFVNTILWIKANLQCYQFHQRLIEDLGRKEAMKATGKKDSFDELDNNSVSSLCGTECSSSTSSSMEPTSTENSNDRTNLKKRSSEGSTSSSCVKPINIFCMDGGGSKGYALLAMGEAIENLCDELFEGDFGYQFDLVAGTSVGGIAALAFSQTGST